MATPNVNITAGESVIIDSNPEDASNNPEVPQGNVLWSFADPGSALLGTLTPQGANNTQCKFSTVAAGPLGVATINITGPQTANPTTAQVTVTVEAGVLDHFSPTFETPTTP